VAEEPLTSFSDVFSGHFRTCCTSLDGGVDCTALEGGLLRSATPDAYPADDLDGTVVHERIYHEAGSDSPQGLTVDELRRLIAEAGRLPVERDTL